MTGVDKYKTMLDGAYAMSQFIMQHYDGLKAMEMNIEEAAVFLKKIMAYCQQQMRKAKK